MPHDCVYHLFKPKSAAGATQCPECDTPAYFRVCPTCRSEVPAPGGPSSIIVVGARSSGKTCYITALIQQIRTLLARSEMLRASVEWENQASRDFFDDKYKTIFVQKILPESTQRGQVAKVDITVRFPRPKGGWRFWRKHGVLTLTFPDPAGEGLEQMELPYFGEFIRSAAGVLLMVDPFAAQSVREHLDEETSSRTLVTDATLPLNKVIKAMRESKPRGLLSPPLAVVVTKCDAKGVFNPDREVESLPDGTREPFHEQGIPYNANLARRLSRRVARHLEEDLEMSEVVRLAENNFKEVSYFAASALGSAPVVEQLPGGEEVLRIHKPKPRRVVEPLLWILHKWGEI